MRSSHRRGFYAVYGRMQVNLLTLLACRLAVDVSGRRSTIRPPRQGNATVIADSATAPETPCRSDE